MNTKRGLEFQVHENKLVGGRYVATPRLIIF